MRQAAEAASKMIIFGVAVTPATFCKSRVTASVLDIIHLNALQDEKRSVRRRKQSGLD
jgi:hypothetical protein